MAFKLAEAFVAISGRTGDLERDIDRAERVAVSGVQRLQGVLAGLSAAGAAIFAGVGLLNAASDAEEISSKFSVVFGNIKSEANSVAEDLARNYGLVGSKGKELLANTGDLLTGFGFTQDSALDLASQVQKLAVDLASFTNFEGGAKGASEALTKALLGERESVKSLGISILDADVKARVALNTSKGLTFATERQAQAYATLQIAQEQSKNAIGDFARTSGGFANQVRLLKDTLMALAESLGRVLLPAATAIVSATQKMVQRFIEVNDALGGLPGLAAMAAASLGALKAAMVAYTMATGQSITMMRAFKLALASTGVGLVVVALGAFVALIAKVAEGLSKIPKVQEAWANATNKLLSAWEIFRDAFSSIMNTVLAAFDGTAGEMAKDWTDFVVEAIDRISNFVLQAAVWFESLVGKSKDVWGFITNIVAEATKFFIHLIQQWPEVVAFQLGLMVRNIVDTFKLIISAARGLWDAVLTVLTGGSLEEAMQSFTGGLSKKMGDVAMAFKAGFDRNPLKLAEAMDFNFAPIGDRVKDFSKKAEEEVKDAVEGSAEVAVKAAVEAEIKEGFMGFADLQKKVQEAFFKAEGKDAEERTAAAAESISAKTDRTNSLLEDIASRPVIAVAGT